MVGKAVRLQCSNTHGRKGKPKTERTKRTNTPAANFTLDLRSGGLETFDNDDEKDWKG